MQLLPLALLLLALSAPALARRGLSNFDGSYEGVELPEDFCQGKSNGRYSVEGHCEASGRSVNPAAGSSGPPGHLHSLRDACSTQTRR